MRAYKTVNDSYIEPISFTVPRRAETFQSDIYPPATGPKAAVSAREWLDGKSGLPPKIDLESVYDGKTPVILAADHPPATQTFSAPPPAAKPKEEPKPAPPAAASTSQASVPVRQPVSTSDQKASISAMANKYQDQEEDSDDDDDASSFEEVSRPPQRAAAPAAREEPKPRSPVKAEPAPVKTTPAAAAPASYTAFSPSSSSAPSGGNISADVYDSLQDIKQMIQEQQKLLRAQSDQIVHLTQEIETLKRKVASGSQDQSERIRQLELELEALRS